MDKSPRNLEQVKRSDPGIFDEPFKHFLEQFPIDQSLIPSLEQFLNREDIWVRRSNYFYAVDSCQLFPTSDTVNAMGVPPLLDVCISQMLALLRRRFNIPDVVLVSASLNRMIPGDYVLPHNDSPASPSTAQFLFSHRAILYLSTTATLLTGGLLRLLRSPNATHIGKTIVPSFGQVFGMQISDKSYHCVDRLRSGTRFTLLVSVAEQHMPSMHPK